MMAGPRWREGSDSEVRANDLPSSLPPEGCHPDSFSCPLHLPIYLLFNSLALF